MSLIGLAAAGIVVLTLVMFVVSTETVPANLLAGSLGFARRGLFVAAEADSAVPTVSLRS
jgi:hypothetical protein